MSDLEKNILSFKKKLSERNILTEDDITELETHIIDKVGDLKENGLNEDDAFNKAVSDLGSIDEIAAEYSKVNLSANVKFMLLCFGYFTINLLLSTIYIISISVSYFIQNIKSAYDYKCTDPLESIYNGEPNYPVLCILLINVALILLMLYLIFKKNNNLLSMISDKILLIQSSKPVIKFAVSFLIVLTPILLSILISLMFNHLLNTMTFCVEQYKRNYMFVDFILLLSFIIRYMKSKASDSPSSYMILGYLLILIVNRFVPSLVLDISILVGQFNIICISLLFIAFFVITCYLLRRFIRNRILEKKPGIIPAALLVIFTIGSYFIYPHASYFDYTLYTPCMIRFGDLSILVGSFMNVAAAACLFSNHKLSFRRKGSIV